MVDLSSSAAYIRKNLPVGEQTLRMVNRRTDIEAKVWELLATPHTIKSLQRAAGDADAHAAGIQVILRRFLDADLIELSPDS